MKTAEEELMWWGWLCPECDSYWEDDSPDVSHQWCACGTDIEPERWDIPEEFQ